MTPNPRLDAWRQGVMRQMVSWPFYAPLDALRRLAGAWLDAGGLGRREAPYRIVRDAPGMALRAYGTENSATQNAGPAVLLVPAPIKGAHIWDLLPGASVVRHLLARGFRVYLVDWPRPGASERKLGLADYADRLLGDCLDAIGEDCGAARVLIAAHSLGGTLAAIFAALHPDRPRGLVLLGAPLNFGDDFGVFAPLVARSPPAARVTAVQGNVPGTFLDSVSLVASPDTFAWSRMRDFMQCLPDAGAMATHLAVERWALEEKPLAARLFEDVWEALFRENRFMSGTLALGARHAAPGAVTAPLLCVVDAHCAVAPPQAMLPFFEAVASREKKLLWYDGDRGVSLAHVGMLVGRNAHRMLWPEIARWMSALADADRAASPDGELARDHAPPE